MRASLSLSSLLLIGVIIPLLASTTATATSLANAGAVSEIDSRTIGMWQTYDGYSVVVNETGFVMALEIKNDGSVTVAWNHT